MTALLSRRSKPGLTDDWPALRAGRVNAHDPIMADGANKARLLPVMGPAVLVILDAIRKRVPATDGRTVQAASEIDPFVAIHAPRRTAECLLDPGSVQFLFQRGEVLAHHKGPPVASPISSGRGINHLSVETLGQCHRSRKTQSSAAPHQAYD